LARNDLNQKKMQTEDLLKYLRQLPDLLKVNEENYFEYFAVRIQ